MGVAQKRDRRADMLYAGFFFSLYIIYLIIVVSECVSNGTKRKLPCANRIISDQIF